MIPTQPASSTSLWSRLAPEKDDANPLVLYHGRQCPDGFAAALAAWIFFDGRGDYIAVDYGQAPPDVTGRNVYVLDFCYPPEVTEAIERDAKQLIVLDHHAGSMQKMHDYTCRCGMVHFDMGKSGARLAWEFFHRDTPAPALIRYVEDRDLWRWRYPETKGYTAKLDTEPQEFSHWRRLIDLQGRELGEYLRQGESMREMFDFLAQDIAKQAQPVVLLGESGMAVMAPAIFHSAVGELLAKQSGSFGLSWCVRSGGDVKVGLRSIPGFDTLALSQAFGGSGHKQASAFRIPLHALTSLLAGTLVPEQISLEHSSVSTGHVDDRALRREVFLSMWTKTVGTERYDKRAWRSVHQQAMLCGLLD